MGARPEPSRLADRDERLGEAVEAYLDLAEHGQAPDPEAFAVGYPDIADELRSALDGLALVQGLVGSSPDGAGRRLPSGHRIAGYRIVRELGRGGMGVVYEAVHVDLDRPVALKVLSTSAAPGSRGRVRFLNEAKTAAGLHHTHIVPVFDVGQVGGLCYYAMQRIEGSGLDRVLRSLRRERTTGAGSTSGRRGHTPTLNANAEEPDSLDSVAWSVPTGAAETTGSWPAHGQRAARSRHEPPAFTPPRGSEYYRWAARAGMQAAEALAYAHRRGVIHRDVKPSNLLVDAKGTVWVADFGLARRVEDPGLTRSDAVVGTPRYMSPEQAEGTPVDGRTDVYSLGATLYELLTLRPPHDGQTHAELLRQITGREPIAPRQIDRKIPRDLETVVLKAMGKRATDRYASSAELADDLRRFLATEPVRARRISPIGRFWRFSRRHPATTGVSAAALAMVLTVAAVAYHRIARERDNALALQGQLSAALTEQQDAARATKLALAQEQLSRAELLRKSPVPNRREAGYDLLGDAARLEPDAATVSKLRDEALELMALRDVVPRVRDLPTGRVSGLTVRPGRLGPTLATLTDDLTEVRVWSPSTPSTPSSFRLEPAPPADETADPMGRGRPPGAGNRRSLPLVPTIAAVGGSLAVVPGEGHGLRWLDPATGNISRVDLGGHQARLVVATDDGRRLVTAEEFAEPDASRPQGDRRADPTRIDGMRVLLWDTSDLETPLEILSNNVFGAGGRTGGPSIPRISVEPSGHRVAVGWWGHPEVDIWDVDAVRKLATVDTGLNLSSLAIGPGNVLAAGGDGKVLLWEVAADHVTPMFGLSEHHGQAVHLRFSPDGSFLAVVGANTGVQLWQLSSNTAVASIPTDDRVVDIAFGSPRSLVIASSSSTSTWEIVDSLGRDQFELPAGANPMNLVFAADGRIAATMSEGPPLVLEPGVCPRRIVSWADAVSEDVAPGPGGTVALVGRETMALYDRPLGRLIHRSSWPLQAVDPSTPYRARLLAHAADGSTLFLAAADRFGRGRGQGRPDGPPPPDGPPGGGQRPRELSRMDAGFPRDGGLVQGASAPRGEGGGRRGGSRGDGPPRGEGPPRGDSRFQELAHLLLRTPEGALRALEFDDSAMLARMANVARWWAPNNVVIDPSGRSVFFIDLLLPDGGRLGHARIEGDRLVPSPFPTLDGAANCLAMSPDGRRLAVGRDNGDVLLIDPESGSTLHSFSVSPEPPADASRAGTMDNPRKVTALAFSPDGTTLAVGNKEGTIGLWRVSPSGEPGRLFRFPGRRGGVSQVVFDPTGSRLAVSDFKFGEPRLVEVWDLSLVRSTLSPLGLGW